MHALAELGVIFLMFLIGLQLSMQRVWELRRWVFGAGAAQVLLRIGNSFASVPRNARGCK